MKKKVRARNFFKIIVCHPLNRTRNPASQSATAEQNNEFHENVCSVLHNNTQGILSQKPHVQSPPFSILPILQIPWKI